jgi:hypothetical protein
MTRGLGAILTGAVLLAGFGETPPEWPVSGAMPDEAVSVPPLSYRSVSEGTRSYRPVAPLPWGDVNRRVAPPVAPEPTERQPHAH